MRATARLRRFGCHVRALREARDLTQEQLARRGLSWRTVQEIERGRTDPRLSTIAKLAEALDVSLAELLDPDVLSMARRSTS